MFVKVRDSIELYLGDRYAPCEFKLRNIHCDLVVNCTSNIIISHDYPVLRVAVEDNGNNEELTKLSALLPEVVDQIVSLIENGKRVLVHCNMGRQRSCTVVAACLMILFKHSCDQAVHFVKHVKCDAFFPANNFYECLVDFKGSKIPGDTWNRMDSLYTEEDEIEFHQKIWTPEVQANFKSCFEAA